MSHTQLRASRICSADYFRLNRTNSRFGVHGESTGEAR